MNPHNRDECKVDECRECTIAEQSEKLLRLAKSTTVQPTARARALRLLADQAKALVNPNDSTPALAGVVLSLCLLLAGCVAPEAIEQARAEAAMCHGLAVETTNDVQVRRFAEAQAAAWRAQHRALTGDDVPGSEVWPNPKVPQ